MGARRLFQQRGVWHSTHNMRVTTVCVISSVALFCNVISQKLQLHIGLYSSFTINLTAGVICQKIFSKYHDLYPYSHRKISFYEPNLSGHLPPDRQTAPGHHGHDGRGVPQRGQHHRQAASRRHGLAAGAEQVLLQQEEGRHQEQGSLQDMILYFQNTRHFKFSNLKLTAYVHRLSSSAATLSSSTTPGTSPTTSTGS